MAAPVVWEDISMANLLTLEILSGYPRPVINIGEDITCLIDSGSDTPVWTQGADRLLDSFAVEKVEGKSFFFQALEPVMRLLTYIQYTTSSLKVRQKKEFRVTG